MGKVYNYDESPLIMELCNYNKIEINYKFTRYDQTLYDVVAYLKEHHELPRSVADKQIKENCMVNICVHNKVRAQINKDCYSKFVEINKPKTYQIGHQEYATGMPVIATSNDKPNGIFNSQMYNFKDVDGNNVALTSENGTTKTVLKENFNKLFDYGFCVTVYKYQGSTIKKDYNVHEVESMSFNEVYTALSRGVALDKVHFVYTPRKFRNGISPTSVRELQIKADTSYQDGKIYKITDKENSFVYIGSTVRTLEERFTEHQVNPTNKLIQEFINKPGVFIELVTECKCIDEQSLLKIEDEYIMKFRKTHNNVVNKKLNIKSKAPVIEIKQQEILERPRDNIKIEDRGTAYRLRWTMDGARQTKNFGYMSCGKEVAMEQAEKFRNELGTELYG
jgi:hypothetical protein